MRRSPDDTRSVDRGNKLYEIKPNDKRVLYAYIDKGDCIILHSFHKKSKKTEKKAINLAVNRLKTLKEKGFIS